MASQHEEVLTYFKREFLAWRYPEPLGIHGYFMSDLEKLAEQGYLDRDEVQINRTERRAFYRLSMKGFSELTDLKTKKWSRASAAISIVALLVSLISLVFFIL